MINSMPNYEVDGYFKFFLLLLFFFGGGGGRGMGIKFVAQISRSAYSRD